MSAIPAANRAVSLDHNSADAESSSLVAADQLKSFIERYERVAEEVEGLKGDMKDIMAEAKGQGFDTKVLREIIKLRKQDYAERQEFEAVLELYKSALNMI